MDLQVLSQDITRIEADAVIVGFHEDIRPLQGGAGALDWLLCGALSRLIMDKRIRGALGEAALLTNAGKVPAGKIVLMGLGPHASFGPDALREAGKAAARCAAGVGAVRVAADLFPVGTGPDDEALKSLQDGWREGTGRHSLHLSLILPGAAVRERGPVASET